MPAAPGQAYLDLVGRAGDRTLADADLTQVQGGVAVEAEDLLDTVERPALNDLEGSPGHDLLGGLEDQPDTSG